MITGEYGGVLYEFQDAQHVRRIRSSQDPLVFVKICSGCGVVKELSEFSPKAGAKSGRHSVCKDCARERVARSRKA